MHYKDLVVEVIDVLEDDQEPDSEVQDSQIHRELTKELSNLETKLNDLNLELTFITICRAN